MLCDIFGGIENSSLSKIYKNKEGKKKTWPLGGK